MHLIQAVVTSVPRYDPKVPLGEFVEGIASIFRQVRRVLRENGTVWVHVSDAYGMLPNNMMLKTMVAPSLLGIPWRIASALQDQNWFVRSELIWRKTNPTPESVRNRPTRAHDSIFLLSRSRHYDYHKAEFLEPNGRNKRSVWTMPGPAAGGMPHEMIRQLTITSTRPGQYVLDPFSVSIIPVCEGINRHAISIKERRQS